MGWSKKLGSSFGNLAGNYFDAGAKIASSLTLGISDKVLGLDPNGGGILGIVPSLQKGLQPDMSQPDIATARVDEISRQLIDAALAAKKTGGQSGWARNYSPMQAAQSSPLYSNPKVA